MKRRLNYTGRQKIERKYVSISLKEKPGRPLRFDIKLDLSGYDFPPESKVCLEAYDRYSAMFFDLGTVENIIYRPNLELSEIIQEDAIRFRLKIIDQTEKHGRILALANNLVTHEPQDPHSIIAVAYENLGNRIWEIGFPDNGQDLPVLRINNQLGKNGIREMVRDNVFFFTLVFPAVVREIMQRIILIDKIFDSDGEDWQNLWLRYIVDECDANPPDERWSEDKQDDYLDEINEWIETEAVESFCREQGVKSKLEKNLG